MVGKPPSPATMMCSGQAPRQSLQRVQQSVNSASASAQGGRISAFGRGRPRKNPRLLASTTVQPPAFILSMPLRSIWSISEPADGARALGKLTESERRQRVLACFAKYFGEEARNPRSYVDKLWEQDPWAHGCYGAFCPPGLLTTHGSVLREPIGTLHFAGTETATVWSGYIDGALSSGERAASEVLAHSSKRVTT